MSLGLFCSGCDRWGEISPNEWLSSGKKDLDYVNQKFKCSECGGQASKQVRQESKGLSTGTVYLSR